MTYLQIADYKFMKQLNSFFDWVPRLLRRVSPFTLGDLNNDHRRLLKFLEMIAPSPKHLIVNGCNASEVAAIYDLIVAEASKEPLNAMRGKAAHEATETLRRYGARSRARLLKIQEDSMRPQVDHVVNVLLGMKPVEPPAPTKPMVLLRRRLALYHRRWVLRTVDIGNELPLRIQSRSHAAYLHDARVLRK